jgi:hypothetical protein
MAVQVVAQAVVQARHRQQKVQETHQQPLQFRVLMVVLTRLMVTTLVRQVVVAAQVLLVATQYKIQTLVSVAQAQQAA